MRIDQMRESGNVEDRRGMGGGGFRGFGGGGGGAGMVVKGGLGSLVLLVIFMLLGGNPLAMLGGGGGGGPGAVNVGPPPGGYAQAGRSDAGKEFVSRVLGDTEDVWTDLFAKMGKRYRAPRLVLFDGYTETGCGGGDAATGPFYCPLDQKVYIDLSFYDELSQRFGAPGDFAQAYVIAHEVGHHVQKLLGITDRVQAMMERSSERERNDLLVRLELQADYFAGVWAHHAQAARRVLESGDVEEGLRCAAAIGDDRLQRRSRGYAVPETFTHGSSAQRVKWFKKGLDSGDPAKGDTFSITTP